MLREEFIHTQQCLTFVHFAAPTLPDFVLFYVLYIVFVHNTLCSLRSRLWLRVYGFALMIRFAHESGSLRSRGFRVLRFSHLRTIGANFASSACSKKLLLVLDIIRCYGFLYVGREFDVYRCSFYNNCATSRCLRIYDV